jgi:hypothetical protein
MKIGAGGVNFKPSLTLNHLLEKCILLSSMEKLPLMLRAGCNGGSLQMKWK